nr:nuclear transport factor 2 family protein [uncultured Rhodopila sp.]
MIIRTLVSSILVCVAGPVLAQTVSASDAKQAATQVAETFASAYNHNKPADIAALFASGGVYLTPGGTILTDQADMTTALAARIRAGWTKEAIHVIDARSEGSDVLAILDYQIQGTGLAAGRQISGYGAQLLTREGTNWRIKLLAGNLKPEQDITGMATATRNQQIGSN